MKEIMLKVLLMEKEYYIIKMGKYMKVNGKIGKEREKVYIIIIMVIEKWEIILMT